jgi:hypothetical protein
MPRSFVIYLLALTFLLSGCWKEPGKFNWANAPGTERYETLMWRAVQEKEWPEVERHLAPAFVGVVPDGQKFDGAGWVGHWKDVQVSEFSMGELTVAPNGADMVVTYTLNLKGAQVPSGTLRVVSVWQQVKNGWILISQSQTPVKNSN